MAWWGLRVLSDMDTVLSDPLAVVQNSLTFSGKSLPMRPPVGCSGDSGSSGVLEGAGAEPEADFDGLADLEGMAMIEEGREGVSDSSGSSGSSSSGTSGSGVGSGLDGAAVGEGLTTETCRHDLR